MGVSGLYTEGQRTCGRYSKTLSGNPEENLPDGIQGRTCGEALFVNFKLPQENRKPPRALSREDFEKIRDVVIPPERITHNIARDLFLFACYTGVPYADAVSITRDNIYKDDKGDLWLKYLRKKNEYLARVKLLPEAISLIENIVRMTGKSFSL